MKKRILSILLALSMLIGVMPMGLFTLTASAEESSRPDPRSDGFDYSSYKTVDVSTWDELDTALTADDNAVLNITKDIHKHTELGGSGTVYCTKTIIIHGNKVIDLNGHEIYNEDDSNAIEKGGSGNSKISNGNSITHTFTVSADSNVIIKDTGGGGKIWTNGYHLGYYIHNSQAGLVCASFTLGASVFAAMETGADWNDIYNNYCYRDLFYVYGSLTVNGGTIDAGKTKEQWITAGFQNFDDEDAKTGYYAQGVGGTGIAVFDGGQLTVNGGTIGGTGAGNQTNYRQYISDYQAYYEQHKYFDSGVRADDIVNDYHPAAAITACKGSTVYIFDGEIVGYNGADAILTPYSNFKEKKHENFNLRVFGGKFRTEKHDRVRTLDEHIDHEGNFEKHYDANQLGWAEGAYGYISIPKDSFTIDTVITAGGSTYKPTEDYLDQHDVTVTCGDMSTVSTTVKLQNDVLYASDKTFYIDQTIKGDRLYYPENNSVLMSRTTQKYGWILYDLEDSSATKQFTTPMASGYINLLSYVDKSFFKVGHTYRLGGMYEEKYVGAPCSYLVNTPFNSAAEFTYSDAVFPESTIMVYQTYNRSALSGHGTVDVFVQIRNLTSSTKIELTSPFSKKVYTKTVNENGTYLFTLDEKEISFHSYKSFTAYITAIDGAGNTIKKNISDYGYIAPWIYSSKTSKYTQETSNEKMLKGDTITFYTGIPVTTTAYSFQWYSADISSNGTVGASTAISGATNSNYSVKFSDNKQYSCEITHKESGKKAYTNLVNLLEDTTNYGAVIETPDGNSASNDSSITLTCNAYNYTGTLSYYWYVKEGPEGSAIGTEISGISGATNRKNIEFPTASFLSKKSPAGTYKIYCQVKDSGTGMQYNTPCVSVNLDRKVESVAVYDRINGYQYKENTKIFLPSETGIVSLKTVASPSYYNENYTVSYSGYDKSIISVSDDGVITGIKPGSTKLYADYLHEDGTKIVTMGFNVIVPISVVDIRFYDKPTVNEYANTHAENLTDNIVKKGDHWYNADNKYTTSINNSVFAADGKYGYLYEFGVKDNYCFPVNKNALKEYYNDGIEIDNTDVNNYLNTNALDVRWHIVSDNPDHYLSIAKNDIYSHFDFYLTAGDNVVARFEFERIYDKTKDYLNSDNVKFNCPQPGDTVTKQDIIDRLYNLHSGLSFYDTFAYPGEIQDLTAKTDGTEVKLEAGHRYRVYLMLSTKAYFSFGDPSVPDNVRLAEDYSLYIDNKKMEFDNIDSKTANFWFEFIPGVGYYVKNEKVGIIEYGAGKVAARMDYGTTNSAGEYLNVYDEAKGSANSSCTVTNIRWTSDDGYNSFLPDGSFKSNTDYTLELTIRMLDDAPADYFYDLNYFYLCVANDDGTFYTRCYGTDLTSTYQCKIENKGKTAVIKCKMGNSGEINNRISVTPGQVSFTATEGYNDAWTVNNSRIFTVKNYSNDTYTNLKISPVDYSADYFVLHSTVPSTLRPDDKATFTVSLKKGLKVGTYKGSYNISFTGNDGKTHTCTIYLSATVTDRDWYYVAGKVILPEEMTDDLYETTEVRLLKEDGTATSYRTDVAAFETQSFSISNVPSGTYIVRASRDGVTPITKKIYVDKDINNVVLDFTDTSGSAEEQGQSGISLDKETAKPGDIVTVRIKLINTDKNSSRVIARISFPEDTVELVSDLQFDGTAYMFHETYRHVSHTVGNTVEYNYQFDTYDGSNTTLSVDTLVAQFRVLDNAKSGNVEVKLSEVTLSYYDSEAEERYYNCYTDDLKYQSANLLILNEDGGTTVSGSLTSFGKDTDEALITLTKEGEDTPTYADSVTGLNGEYSISGVAAGTYTMSVSKTKHCTREYTVVVGSDDVVQNAEIRLYGDLDSDGVITVADALAVLRIAAKLATAEGYEKPLSDVDFDSDITVADALAVLRVAAKLADGF